MVEIVRQKRLGTGRASEPAIVREDTCAAVGTMNSIGCAEVRGASFASGALHFTSLCSAHPIALVEMLY